jgi:hypothetical protein
LYQLVIGQANFQENEMASMEEGLDVPDATNIESLT